MSARPRYSMSQSELRQEAWAYAFACGALFAAFAAVVLVLAVAANAKIDMNEGTVVCSGIFAAVAGIVRCLSHIPSPTEQIAMRNADRACGWPTGPRSKS